VDAYYCKNAASEPCPERAYVHAVELDAFVAEWFAWVLEGEPRMIDVVAAARDLEEAQAEQTKAEGELYAYVEAASALDGALFQRGVEARQTRVDRARARVRELSARITRLPAGGVLADLWHEFGPAERRDVLAGFLGRVEVSRGASGDLTSHVRISWSDGTLADLDVANDRQRIRVAAA